MPGASPSHQNISQLCPVAWETRVKQNQPLFFGPLSFVVLLHLAIPEAACQPALKLCSGNSG